MNPSRRSLIKFLQALGATLLASPLSALATPLLRNPCHEGLPPHLAEHPLLQEAWQGINPADFWDCHAHIAGVGDSGSGIRIAKEMNSLLHPLSYLQRYFYLNAACVDQRPGQIDRSYIARLRHLLAEFPQGAKLLLLAFDLAHAENGQPLPEQSAFYVPNSFAHSLAKEYPDRFEWIASIHPYRLDAVEALQQAHAQGARAIKWLPPAMGIDPASARCQPFYAAMAKLDLPLLCHTGEEKAVAGLQQTAFGNPLRLRAALDSGVRVIMAHCASLGEEEEEQGEQKVSSFSLFGQLLDDPQYRSLLFGDISAITLRNRHPSVLKTLLERSDWHHRLLNGSDYPLPGIIPLISPSRLANHDLLDPSAISLLNELQTYNPLLFDFVLKRQLRSNGQRFPAQIFATRPFFLRHSP
ncbi:amidohydrolase family protein [Candidatus Magnetaquicoccus inordinatus]|uniref:amidohydrolase family protein n=1 Tax=Candidatus Magnetaquicoccus inordinatus TaxID=2496818 RepID=UPI00102BDDAF|nr:amidohydrolase family protein [Candidatus Magnetaquicoccus inordinatus]